MKKQVLVLLSLALLLVGNALAETFTTPINITLFNNTATVATESWANTYSCNQTSTVNQTLSIQRNFSDNQLTSCQNSLGSLNMTVQVFTDSLKDIKAYYPLYTQCYANLTSCQTVNDGLKNTSSDNAVLQSKYEGCTNSLNAVMTTKEAADDKLITCTGERATLSTENRQLKSDIWKWIGLGGLVVAVGAYFKYEKGWGKTPLEKEMPGKA